MSNKQESRLIRDLDNLRLYDELMPAIRAMVVSGGGADNILKKSEALAAVQLVEALDSKKDDVKLKASIEILNRTLGRPVERTLNIYGDISKLNERDIDNQIMRLVEKTGSQALIEALAKQSSLPRPKRRYTRRKPKTVVIEQPNGPTESN